MRHSTTRRAARRAATLAALTSLGAVALGASSAFGPPWISIETPPNPYDRASRGAFLVVNTFHHGNPNAAGVTGAAEGLVDGARRTVPLSFEATSRPGSYALRKQWPTGGVWMLVINTGGRTEGATALVELGGRGEVTSVRVPTRQQGEWTIPAQVTARDIDEALGARAARVASSAR
ncbi:MAG TPA: hypothetical protein VFZ21_22200 [Gemmatimonadaceae bacterium]|jgi:hypothetical protein|nr:hypothetical protein [Gemmatimonadaceae bacterium]